MLNLTIFLKFCEIFFKFFNGLFSPSQCFSFLTCFSHVFLFGLRGLGLKGGALSRTVTATEHVTSHILAHRPFPRARTFFRSVIECTATGHVIFSRCIYTSFHGNLVPLA